MKKFKFRLDTLLKVRSMHKEQAQTNFAAAENKLLAAKALLDNIEKRLAESMKTFRDAQSQIICIEVIKSYNCYFSKTKDEIALQVERVKVAELEKLQALRSLDEALKNLKVIEELHSKRLGQFNAELLREEQQYLDDLGMQLYVRQVR
ncbi:flagellar export protein FliJ [Dendrosporobacter sp. 1207_IL3150]|uniref:flagellar export protein FliJ n=1 Tax=Dendrosporobacter sp. 1207_IL3150 TaxID=3084054 RepID=UPI002FD87E56